MPARVNSQSSWLRIMAGERSSPLRGLVLGLGRVRGLGGAARLEAAPYVIEDYGGQGGGDLSPCFSEAVNLSPCFSEAVNLSPCFTDDALAA